MEQQSEDIQQQSSFKGLLQNRWVWLSLTVVLLGISAFVIAQSVQSASVVQSEIAQAQKNLTAHEELVKNSEEIEASGASCVAMVAARIQQLEAFKGSLSVISAEYRNMYHAGIGNVNVDAYSEALNNVVAESEALDSQDLGACDAK